METPDIFEQKLLRSNEQELIILLMNLNFLKREFFCPVCNEATKLVTYRRSNDKYAWRCMKSQCSNYKKYFSVRTGSFFYNFNISITMILRIMIKFSIRQPRYSIKENLDAAIGTVDKVLNKLITLIPEIDFFNDKLGGPGCNVQIDETMLNYKCKSHRGRSPRNETDSLCIVELKENITRAFAVVIPNKAAATLVPIICRQVAQHSIIWTDEHKSYGQLRNHNFTHGTVCHKYEFINHMNGVNTQAVESFNNCLKLEIKRRKGVETDLRQVFLKEFCFFFQQ